MRALLKLLVAGAVASLAAAFLRRLLEQAGPQPDASDASPAGPASAPPPAPVTSNHAPSRDELYKEAARLDVKGRSKMNKRQLQEAVEAARTGGSS